MGNFKCIKPASHRNKSRWPGTNQEKKIASESIRISAQMQSTFHQAETAPLLSSLLHDSQETCAFLSGLLGKVMDLTAWKLWARFPFGVRWWK